MIDIKLGGEYEISELRMAGYSPDEVFEFKDTQLIETYGTKAIKYRRGNENLLVIKDSGLLRVIVHFDPSKAKRVEIFRKK